jgi:outer membrane protein assembly factor BamB
MVALKNAKRVAILLLILDAARASQPGSLSGSCPQFRGSHFDNIFRDQRPPAEFGPEKNVAWKAPLPRGQGSLCIFNDKIFLTAFDDHDTLETIALSRRDGTLLWKREVKTGQLEPYFEKLGTPATSTPATDGQHVVSYFGSFGLLCYDLDGRELWRVKMPLPQTKDGFGSGTSPIIHNGLVYLLRDEDGPGQGLYALDVKTGKEIWKRKRDGFRVSFGSPVVWDGGIVVIGDLRVKSYDPQTGADRWVVRGLAAYPCTTPAPGPDGNLYVATWSNGSSNERNMPDWKDFLAAMDKDKDGKLSIADSGGTFLADFFNIFDKNKNGFVEADEWQSNVDFMGRGKNVVLAIKPGGQGDITETHVLWSNEKGAPYVASPLAYEGRLYLIKDGGLLTVYDTSIGKLLLDKERLAAAGDYFASPIAAGGRIYLASQKGEVLSFQPGDKPELLFRTDLAEPISATPAVLDHTLYIRTAKHLWAFRERAP